MRKQAQQSSELFMASASVPACSSCLVLPLMECDLRSPQIVFLHGLYQMLRQCDTERIHTERRQCAGHRCVAAMSGRPRLEDRKFRASLGYRVVQTQPFVHKIRLMMSRWFRVWQLLQRTWVQFPAPTW